MNRAVEWNARVLADLAPLDRTTQERIREAIYRLADTNYGDVEKLHGMRETWRLRVGQWRVRFTTNPATNALRVLRVLPRSSAFRE